MSATAKNREEWLTDFAKELVPLIRERTGLRVPSTELKLSCGFPSKGGTRRKGKRIGECHHVHALGPGKRNFSQLFIHPELVDEVQIGGTVAHEILHACLPAGVGHRKPFSQAAKKLGLEGKPTATEPGEELAGRLKTIAENLGPYPHEALTGLGGPTPKNPLLKLMCPVCGYLLRGTQKWLDEAGAPICPQCMVAMEVADVGDLATDPLTAGEQTIEYHVKALDRKPGEKMRFDPRFSIRMNRYGQRANWLVIDYGPSLVPETGLAVLGTVYPRITPAESRQDAIALLEALRDGTMTYDDIEVEDDNDDKLSTEDLFYEDEYEETGDFEDQQLTDEENAEYDHESEQRGV